MRAGFPPGFGPLTGFLPAGSVSKAFPTSGVPGGDAGTARILQKFVLLPSPAGGGEGTASQSKARKRLEQGHAKVRERPERGVTGGFSFGPLWRRKADASAGLPRQL